MNRWLAALCLIAGCGDSSTASLFTLPELAPDAEFYELPFPNDIHRHDDGSLELSRLPANSALMRDVRAAAQTLDGFGLNQAIYLRFDGELDPASLPDAIGSVDDAASVYLIDVDPDSPGYGQRSPILVRFRAEAGETIGPNHLIARPYPGFGLTEATTYALVVTDRVRDSAGNSPVATSTFAQLLGDAGDTAVTRARERYQPLLDFLDEPGGDDRDDVISAAVFTTQRTTFVVPAIRKAVHALAAPAATGITKTSSNAVYSVFLGSYQAANFQVGAVPYRDPPNGQIMIGTDGTAIVERMEPMRFALTVPAGTPPTTGWPIAVCQHGTTSDYLAFVDDGTAGRLASEGVATISTDQVLHGPRNPGGNPALDFFNITNVYAARDNALQGTADAFSLLRLALGLSIPDGGRTITFDPDRVSFFGHSQGGLTGPGFVVFEPRVTGAVFSGTGGLLYLSLLYKTLPFDIPTLVHSVLGDDPVDEDNPSLALVQMWIERSDGANYAPLMVRRPPLGGDGLPLPPRNIFQTEGFIDRYSPNPAIEAFATAIGGDLAMLPATRDVPGLTALHGRTIRTPPVAANLNGVTAVLAQYQQASGSDGHFVVLDIPTAQRQAASFLGTLANTGQATVVP